MKTFNVFLLTKILVRGELALDNGQQLHIQFVKIPTIPSLFRRHFVGSKFWLRDTGATHSVSGGHRWLQLSNGRGAWSITWLGTGFPFSSVFFFQVSLLYHLLFLEDVFNNGFWKICLKITNDLEPGINLLEQQELRQNQQNNNFARASHFSVHFFSVNVSFRRENENVYF